MSNFILTAEDNNYPQRGGISALVGIYGTEERAETIKGKVVTKYGENSIFKIEPTEFPVTEPVKIPE